MMIHQNLRGNAAQDMILKAESLYGDLRINILPSKNDAV